MLVFQPIGIIMEIGGDPMCVCDTGNRSGDARFAAVFIRKFRKIGGGESEPLT